MNGDFESDDGYSSEDDLPQSRSRSPSRSRSVSPLRDYSTTTPVMESWMEPPYSSDPVETVVEPPPYVEPISTLVPCPPDLDRELDITMIMAVLHTFKNAKRDQWCYTAFDKSSCHWIQVRCSQIDHLKFTDHTGRSQSAVNTARSMPGARIKLGTGADSKGNMTDETTDADTYPSAAVYGTIGNRSILSERRCVSDALYFLVPSNDYQLLPTGDDLRLDHLPMIFRNASVKLLRPSKWGFIRDCTNYVGGIDDLCTHAKIDDRFLLRVTLIAARTSLHAVAVMNQQILSPSLGWLPLTPDSFKTMDIASINAGYKIVSK